MFPMEAEELKQRTRALSEEDRVIVTANIPLVNMRREIARREEEADRKLSNAERALIPYLEHKEEFTLELKEATIINLHKAIGAQPVE